LAYSPVAFWVNRNYLTQELLAGYLALNTPSVRRSLYSCLCVGAVYV